ncbi:hypothetical protein [Gluconobacter oxydans]
MSVKLVSSMTCRIFVTLALPSRMRCKGAALFSWRGPVWSLHSHEAA